MHWSHRRPEDRSRRPTVSTTTDAIGSNRPSHAGAIHTEGGVSVGGERRVAGARGRQDGKHAVRAARPCEGPLGLDLNLRQTSDERVTAGGLTPVVVTAENDGPIQVGSLPAPPPTTEMGRGSRFVCRFRRSVPTPVATSVAGEYMTGHSVWLAAVARRRSPACLCSASRTTTPIEPSTITAGDPGCPPRFTGIASERRSLT